MSSPPTYTSHFSIPYTSPPSPLRTLDLHIPTTPPHLPSYTLIYIHGGAFRDPLLTSQSLLPSLPHLFPSQTPPTKNLHRHHQKIAAIASINYRLSPYPTHPTHPSTPDDESRNARWPDPVRDVRAAIHWLGSEDGAGRNKFPTFPTTYIIIGHSVGATIAFALALGLDGSGHGTSKPFRAIVGVEGIYDFTALRDAHLASRGIYEEFITAALGAEERGGWDKGNMVRGARERRETMMMMEGTEVVVLGHSRADELVEWRQVEMMGEALRGQGWQAGDGGQGKQERVG
ncbi:MAG: hypothetical protein LQ338_006867 [Usnochroma carphineum]|nr:MAG: hypothetical protein LQ338_006867 [Usnochroma carphineum]